mgnify:CR=1 FL=1
MNGLCIPGVPIIGNVSSGGSGGADLSDIDATTEITDSRLLFECLSPRAYYAADGTIQFAAPNTWPLEYKDGVAIGRHEPEPMATNLKIGSRAPTATLYQLTKTSNTALSPAGIDELIEFATAYTSGTPTLFSDVTLSESGPLTVSVIGRNGTAEMTVRKEGTTDSVGFTSDFGRSVLISNYDATATRNRYSIYFPRTVGDVAYIWHIQLEAGEIATSPIITTDSAATRAAGLAFVPNPGLLATAARIYYTDGTTYDIEFNGAARGAIPQASKHWGTRYIEGVSYAKGFSR